MRVKVRDEWFEVGPGCPIGVELTVADKKNIADMHPDATMYGCFDDSETDVEAMRKWMSER